MDKRQTFLNIATTFILLAVAAMLGASIYYKSYLRFGEACVDFWGCLKHYFLFAFHRPTPTEMSINNPSSVMAWLVDFPANWSLFKQRAVLYGETFANKQNVLAWLANCAQDLHRIAKVLILVLPFMVLIGILVVRIYKMENNHYNVDTIPLRRFKKFSERVYQPFKRFLVRYKDFLEKNSMLVTLFLAIWLFNLNGASIFVSAIGYYLYFSTSFDTSRLYMQGAKLVMDLQVFFYKFPWYLLLPFVWVAFCKWRERVGVSRLQHMEAMNCGFINSLPIVTMVCGSMGKKKTTTLTDMALSQNVMFRQEAYKRLVEIDMRFPNFPWIEFERELRRCMAYKTVHNLATIRDWVRLKQRRFNKHWDATLQLYGYDYYRYGLTYDDKLKIIDLFDAMESYAQLYFIYVLQSSLLVANYSIREDCVYQDIGNFPIWGNNFFAKQRPRKYRYAHVLDFDTIRLGKKMLTDNPNIGSFEFGVVAITEVGKERGNALELKEVKKNAEEANQKNDGFNSWLKMCRHPATIDNYPFIKVLADEQRPESWGADARDLCDIVRIIETEKNALALPFFVYEDMLCDWIYNWFGRLYQFMRFHRGDNTLLVHLLKNITAKVHSYQKRVYNRFGYSALRIDKERGTMDGKAEKCRYYLSNYKIYSNRFATDCFNGYFAEGARKTFVGMDDYPEYRGIKASVAELHEQHSYFIEGMYTDEGGDY